MKGVKGVKGEVRKKKDKFPLTLQSQ